jgi:DNA-directed RNA polymerase specialized sigma24 family protein
MRQQDVDWIHCEALADRAADGDPASLNAFLAALCPAWDILVRGSPAMGRLRRSDDHVSDVVTGLIEKFSRGDGHRLRQHRSWRAQHPDKTFEDWMHIVVANVVRDHMRSVLGETRSPSEPGKPSRKRLLNEFANAPALERLGARPPMTEAQTARQLLEFARERLPADQHGALMRWLEGETFEEIEAKLGLPSEASEKLVRAALATLRRHFRAVDEKIGGGP